MTGPARRALHGVVLEVEDLLEERPSAVLLDALPAPLEAAAPAIRVRLIAAPRPAASPPGRPLFFHGAVRAFGEDSRTSLWDGHSTVTVSLDGCRIDGEVHSGSLEERDVFASTLLLMALLLALRRHGLFHLHAAALGRPAGAGLLVAANGGCGKTTVAVALASAGFEFLGDDTVLLALRGGRPAVLAWPRPFHVGERTARAFPQLAPFLGAAYGETGKRFLDAASAFGRAPLAAAGPPAVILFTSIGGEESTRIEAVSPAVSLGKLIEASAFVAVDGAAGVEPQLAVLAKLADGARGYAVTLGRDLLEAPASWVERLVRRIGLGGT